MSRYLWFYKSNIPYAQYLQAKEFEDTAIVEISKNSRAIIASNERLAEQHVAVLTDHWARAQEQQEATAQTLERIEFSLESINRGIEEINWTFHWGLSHILARLGSIGDSIEDLVRIAKTPAQTWAYENFEHARDCFARGLHRDALDFVDRALTGYGSNTGYHVDHRFHYLKGLIKLGTYQNADPSVLDYPGAVNCFLAAVRYAGKDHPSDGALAYLGAAWGEYVQGHIEAAIAYTKEALRLSPKLAEAHFLSAKLLFAGEYPERAIESLGAAIRLDRTYSLKALIDGDCQSYAPLVDSMLQTLRNQARETAAPVMAESERILHQVRNTECGRYKLTSFDLPAKAQLDRALLDARNAFTENSLFGFQDAVGFLSDASQLGAKAIKEFYQAALKAGQDDLAKLNGQIKRELAKQDAFYEKIPTVGGGIGTMVFFLILVITDLGNVYGAANLVRAGPFAILWLAWYFGASLFVGGIPGGAIGFIVKQVMRLDRGVPQLEAEKSNLMTEISTLKAYATN